MTTTLDRLDPSQLAPGDIDKLQHVLDEHAFLFGREGLRLELPSPIYHLLEQVIRSLRNGDSVVVTNENERLSTQAAADLLGVSRPFLIKLLERGEIDFDRTGTHRRIRVRDLREYMAKRSLARRAVLDDVYAEIDRAGLYEQVPAAHDMSGNPA